MKVEVKTAVLKHFSGRGFGFLQIIEDGVYKDIFFHISSVIKGRPTAGAVATFNDGVAKGRRVAVNVCFDPPAARHSAVDEILAGVK